MSEDDPLEPTTPVDTAGAEMERRIEAPDGYRFFDAGEGDLWVRFPGGEEYPVERVWFKA